MSKLNDRIYATIIAKSIGLNEKRIRAKVKSYSHKSTDELYEEMTTEILKLFHERKTILKVVFHELSKLPKTKSILFDDNLIILCLKEEMARRNRWSTKIADEKVSVAVSQYMDILINKVLKSRTESPTVHAELIKTLQESLS